MKFQSVLIIPILLCFSISSFCQPNKLDFNRIGIGDKIPEDLPLINLVNYPKSDAKISDFEGKLLILDYWFTGCGPCISSWPKLMELQRKFDDKIQIMLVNHMQSDEVVKQFINNKNEKSEEVFSIPSVTGDTILYKILPPFGYPSIVWIDHNGIYRASTNGEDLNEENIQSLLNNINIGTKSLTDNTSFINLKRPLFIDGNGGSGQQMFWYSTVSKYSDKIKDGLFLMSADSSGYVIATTHKPIIDLIMRAYCDGPFKNRNLVNYVRLPRTQIDIQVKDPTRLLDAPYGQRLISNLYTYQLISYEPKTITELKEIMRDDIRKYFNLNMEWQKIKKKCLVLTAGDTTLLSDFTNNYDRPIYGYTRDRNMYLTDVTIDNFFGYLTEYAGGIYSKFDGYPLIDETGFNGGLDLVFEHVTPQNHGEIFSDYKKLNEVLSQYKMHFKLEEREIDVLVISDAKNDKSL